VYKPVILTSLLLIAIAPATQAASFDCEKASTADEKAICADRALNDKDVRMALLYSFDRRFMGMGAWGALMYEQADWLKQRRACGARRDCLHGLYDKRIAGLRKFIDERVVTQGPF
jgi:uncharacterized protein